MKKAPIKTHDYILLEDEFKAQCLNDRNTAEYQISESKYLSVPYLTDNPEFVIIALEPGFRKVEYIKEIDFLMSLRNYIIHYCAYYYLSEEGYNYYLTDISKSAMKSSLANTNKMRNKLYSNWYPLLQKEINILSDTYNSKSPRIIPLGPTVETFLKRGKINFHKSDVVYHYGDNNNRIFKNFYSENFSDVEIKFTELFENLKIFAEQITEYLSFTQEEKNDMFVGGSNHKGIFDTTHFSIKQKEQLYYRYLYYKRMFEDITKNAL